MSGISPVGLNVAEYQELTFSSKMSEQQKIEKATQQFEGVMIRQYLKDAMKPLIETEMTKNSASDEIYRSYLVDIMSSSMAQSGGFGLSNTLQAGIQAPKSKTPEG